ncbi:hypothetical protein [Clostridium sp. AN503]|uniref:hypothetical protein n=1 Tax=Clostridium sp. AN503 TaxID=3160598 RepID=UPI0034583B6D
MADGQDSTLGSGSIPDAVALYEKILSSGKVPVVRWVLFFCRIKKVKRKTLTYGAPYVMIYTKGGENQMRGGSRKKKPDSKFKTWLVGMLTDLVVGIILLIVSKLLE